MLLPIIDYSIAHNFYMCWGIKSCDSHDCYVGLIVVAACILPVHREGRQVGTSAGSPEEEREARLP